MYHSAVGRGTGISIRATTGGKNGLVVLGYHSRSCFCSAVEQIKSFEKIQKRLRFKITVEVVFCAAFAQIRSFGVNYINSKLGVNYINSKLNSVGEREREREREIVI